MTKVHILTHEFYPKKGGAGVYCEEIAKGHVNAEGESVVWVPCNHDLNKKHWPFEIVETPLRGNQGWISRWKLRRFLIQNRSLLKGQIVHIAEPGAMIAFLSFPSLIKVLDPKVLILTFHGTELIRFYHKKKKRLSLLVSAADRVTVISPYVRDLFLERFPEESGKIILTHAAPRLIPTDSNMEIAKSENLKIICVARIHPRKGQLAILEAISMLTVDEQKKIELTLVGQIIDQDYYKTLQIIVSKLVAKIHFEHNVTDEQLSGLLSGSNLFMMTSMPSGGSIEGLGLSYLEASAHGLPIIAHDIGGVKYAVEQGETGFLVSPEDRKELADAIRLFLADPFKREEMGRKGKERALCLDWSQTAMDSYKDFEMS